MSGKVQKAAVRFQMDGREYGFTMPAESFEDAERRMQAIRMTGRVIGWPCYQVKMPMPLAYLLLPFMPFMTAFLNMFFRRRPPQ